MIFKKAIPRRTFLRGLGATLALPLLDGMVPVFASAGGKILAKPMNRLSIVFVPNGRIMEKWTPAVEGAAFEWTPILEPLAPFRERLLVLSGLAHKTADALPNEGDGGPHERGGAAFLTGVHPRRTSGANIYGGISVDQIAARELGKHTQLASLELGMEPNGIGGACENGWSCAYINTLSWRTPTTPLPVESNPRAVFERLFGDHNSTDPAEQRSLIQENRSILDALTEELPLLMGGLGPADRLKLTEYLDAIRDVERRIQRSEEQASRELPVVDRPAGIPATYEEHVKLMFDLQVLAYQCDLTRVITFMMGREKSDYSYREIGISEPYHPLTHHQNDPVKIAKVLQINIFHAKMFAYFLEKLRSTPDGDGSLLDHLTILHGSCLSDGNQHKHDNLPVLLVGGAVGRQFKGGRHLRYPEDTPMPNLYLTLLDSLGTSVDQLGDSNGKLDLLPVG
ncbi:MAG: DUF1552 domain-containing protein [Acidobacteria bacterium]|nr:DUF1552 domain-containing protein [Acidobacteriota bacterium]